MARPRIVISNDDGIEAPGLETLLRVLEDIAECRVVAPDSQRSGVGHSVSDDGRVAVSERPGRGHAVDGTPAECARLALGPGPELIPEWATARQERQIWLLSGINHGANLGVDTYVSGTAAAAREAAILGFPALAISQYVGRHRKIDWSRTLLRARPVIEELLDRPPAAGVFWNVNLPHPHDEAVHCEIVHCPADPSPLPVRYERSGDHYAYSGDYHQRPRRRGHDVDVCFSGRIAVSEIGL